MTFIRLLSALMIAVLMWFVTPFPAQAGGPLRVDKTGAPFRWQGPINLTLDSGSFGTYDGRALVQAAIDIWKTAPHTKLPEITLLNDTFDQDITAENIDQFLVPGNGITPIIFDNDGSIIRSRCPAGSNCERFVIGLAIHEDFFVDPVNGPTITEGAIILNGLFAGGSSVNGVPNLPWDQLVGTVVHELGHLLGLGHSQLNLLASPDRDADPTNDIELPTMFPFNHSDATTLHLDDQTAIATLYPSADFALSTGKIEGKILGPGIPTPRPFQGANVVIRKVSGQTDSEGRPIGSRIEAVSAVSGARFLPRGLDGQLSLSTNPELEGLYEATGLPPGNYLVEVEPIDPALRDLFGVGPIDPPVKLDAQPEFYNGADESSTRTDRVADRVVVSAGSSGIDILLNIRPEPIPISTAPLFQGMPVAAFDGTNFLVVWEDARSCILPLKLNEPPYFFTECGYDLFGARITPEGKVLDPEGIPISVARGHQMMPQISFGGGRYLVVWQDSRDGPLEGVGELFHIYGSLIIPGDALNPPTVLGDFPISTFAPGIEFAPKVVYDETNFFVVWRYIYTYVDPGDSQTYGGNAGSFGSRVTVTGNVLDRYADFNPNLRSSVALDMRSGLLSLAFGAGYYLSVYRGPPLVLATFSPEALAAYASNPSGKPGVDKLGYWFYRGPSSGHQGRFASISFGGEQFFVVVESYEVDPITGKLSESRGRISGAIIDPSSPHFVNPSYYDLVNFSPPRLFPISAQEGEVYFPKVVLGGSQFVVAWNQSSQKIVSEYDILGARVSEEGQVLDSHDLDIMTDPEGQGSVALASGNGKILVVWNDYRRLRSFPHVDIFGQIITVPGLVAFPSELRFDGIVGGASPAPKNFALIEYLTEENTQWTSSVDAGWLTIAPTGGTTPTELTASVNSTGLAAGDYSGRITIETQPLGATLQVPVTLTMRNPPIRKLSIVSGSGQEAQVGTVYPNLLIVKVTDENGNPIENVDIAWEVVSGGATFISENVNVGQDFNVKTNSDGRAEARVQVGPAPAVNRYKVTCGTCLDGHNEVFFEGMAMKIEITLEKTSVLPRPLGSGTPENPQAQNQSNVLVTVLPVEAGRNREFVEVRVSKAEGGGHDAGHATPRPTGNLLKPVGEAPPAIGACLSDIAPGGITKGKTDSNGQVVFPYISCEISGEETIEASIMLKSGLPLKTEATITIEVPGLVALPPGGGLYIRCGKTEGCTSDPHPDPAHPSPHNGVATLRDKVLNLAFTYKLELKVASDVDHLLRVSDMSLPQGGLFDIKAKWSTAGGHKGHRKGTSVDISRHALVINTAGEEQVVTFSVDQRLLDDIAKDIGLMRLTETSASECPVLQPGEPACIHYDLP